MPTPIATVSVSLRDVPLVRPVERLAGRLLKINTLSSYPDARSSGLSGPFGVYGGCLWGMRSDPDTDTRQVRTRTHTHSNYKGAHGQVRGPIKSDQPNPNCHCQPRARTRVAVRGSARSIVVDQWVTLIHSGHHSRFSRLARN